MCISMYVCCLGALVYQSHRYIHGVVVGNVDLDANLYIPPIGLFLQYVMIKRISER